MILYFDCFSGVSGDMILGALVDAGVPFDELKKGLRRLKIRGYDLQMKRVKRAGIACTKIDVLTNQGSKRSSHRMWSDVRGVIERSTLTDEIRQKGMKIFRRLFSAEARIHGSRYDRVNLHELAAVDCMVDIFGTLIALDWLGVESIHSSPVNMGGGSIRTSHGLLPAPSPAATELLKGKPVYSSDIQFELTTPTGAVLVSSLATEFGPLPGMSIVRTGFGAGNKDLSEQPNVLRVLIGNKWKDTRGEDKQIIVIETNIDDMPPQIYEYVMQRLFDAGALDVFMTPIVMKKSRPAVKLSVICSDDTATAGELSGIVMAETSSIGLRYYRAERMVLEREIKRVSTSLGSVRVKITRRDNSTWQIIPEYDDCKRLATRKNLPLAEVIRIAEQDARKSLEVRSRGRIS